MTTQTTLEHDNAITLQAEIADILREAGQASATESARLAKAVIDGLKKRMAGGSIYIASGLNSSERDTRDRAIRSEYNGRNRLEVCAKYRVSKARLYQIIARQGKGRMARGRPGNDTPTAEEVKA